MLTLFHLGGAFFLPKKEGLSFRIPCDQKKALATTHPRPFSAQADREAWFKVKKASGQPDGLVLRRMDCALLMSEKGNGRGHFGLKGNKEEPHQC